MKKLYTLMMMAMMGLMTVSLTSCEDEQIAKKTGGRVIYVSEGKIL